MAPRHHKKWHLPKEYARRNANPIGLPDMGTEIKIGPRAFLIAFNGVVLVLSQPFIPKTICGNRITHMFMIVSVIVSLNKS